MREEKGNNVVTRGGVGFCSLLGLLFIALKLTGFIDWPWLWVLAPLWIPLALVALVFAVVFVWTLLTKF